MLRQGIDYDSYKLSVRENVTGIAVYSVIAVMVSVLFFDSLIPCLVFTPGILVFLRKIADGKCRQRKNKLNNEFKEMLLSLSANMAAGYSLEKRLFQLVTSWKECIRGNLISDRKCCS